MTAFVALMICDPASGAVGLMQLVAALVLDQGLCWQRHAALNPEADCWCASAARPQ